MGRAFIAAWIEAEGAQSFLHTCDAYLRRHKHQRSRKVSTPDSARSETCVDWVVLLSWRECGGVHGKWH